jgi:hypothetical protein
MDQRTGCSTLARMGGHAQPRWPLGDVQGRGGRSRGRHPSAAQVDGRDPRHSSLFRGDCKLIRRDRCGRAVETRGVSFDPVHPEPTPERMRKDVHEFIRLLEAVGLTVEATPGHRVLRGPPRKANRCHSHCRSRPTRSAGVELRSSSRASSASACSGRPDTTAAHPGGRIPRCAESTGA